MDIPLPISEYLDKKINEHGNFDDVWVELKDFYARKLWHQLTLKLQSCFANQEFKEQTDLVELNEIFLNDIKSRINPLALGELCVPISEQLLKTDPHQAIKFIEDVRNKYAFKSKEAVILCNTTIGMIYLCKLNDLPKSRELIESTSMQLEQLGRVTCVHPRFYELSSRYYQVTSQHAEYYQEALKFLGCVNLSDLSLTEQRDWALRVGLAAILGEGVYNFGELLTNNILLSLHDTPQSWLVDLLNAFNHGDINQFDALRSEWSTSNDLVAAETHLRAKVTLLCLTEMIFRRPPNKRTLSFSEITIATAIPEEQVEHLVMRALSLGLIKGRIDQVDRSISISWLKPRVLDREQIASICTRLTDWCRSVADVKKQLIEINSTSPMV